MKKTVAVLGVLLTIFGTYVFSVQPETPFVSDGCTLFPDSAGGMDWAHCCENHDRQYFDGGTHKERKDSDWELGQCVGQAAHPVLGFVMQYGVRVTGTPYMPTYYRWGFGLPYGNFYE